MPSLSILRSLGLSLALWLCLPLWLSGPARAFEVPKKTSQLMVVVTRDWSATDGKLLRLVRHGRSWSAVGKAVSVTVGKTGLGWGRGELPSLPDSRQPGLTAAELAGPMKQEGDGRAPAGVFRLSLATGYAARGPKKMTLPYAQASERLVCVDDPEAPEYNRVFAMEPGQTPTWKSDEKMRRADALYEWTIVVMHNPAPSVKGAGSCIFMHVWRGPGQATVGCTAMEKADLELLLGWLERKREPLLLQLPEPVYRAVQKAWGLPRIQ